jgi:hypothetical protein
MLFKNSISDTNDLKDAETKDLQLFSPPFLTSIKRKFPEAYPQSYRRSWHSSTKQAKEVRIHIRRTLKFRAVVRML